MKILLFGGTTFVSKHFTQRLIENGYEVTTLNRGTKKGLHGSRVDEVYADRHCLADLQKALEATAFDYVIDVSCYTLADAKNAYECIRCRKIDGYLFVSSSAVYRGSEVLPMTESFETGTNGVWGKYGTDKLEAEGFFMQMSAENGFPILILRPPYIYGEGNNIYREAFVFDRLQEAKAIVVPGAGKTLAQFIHIEDLFRTAMELIKRNVVRQVFNVGNPEAISFQGWIDTCATACGKSAETVHFEYRKSGYQCRDFFPFYDYQYFLDIAKVSAYYIPQIGLEAGLRQASKWYAGHSDEVAKKPQYNRNSDEILNSLKVENDD